MVEHPFLDSIHRKAVLSLIPEYGFRSSHHMLIDMMTEFMSF